MRDETVERSVLIPARLDDGTVARAGLRIGRQFSGSKPGLSGGAWMVGTNQEWAQSNCLTIWVQIDEMTTIGLVLLFELHLDPAQLFFEIRDTGLLHSLTSIY